MPTEKHRVERLKQRLLHLGRKDRGHERKASNPPSAAAASDGHTASSTHTRIPEDLTPPTIPGSSEAESSKPENVAASLPSTKDTSQDIVPTVQDTTPIVGAVREPADTPIPDNVPPSPKSHPESEIVTTPSDPTSPSSAGETGPEATAAPSESIDVSPTTHNETTTDTPTPTEASDIQLAPEEIRENTSQSVDQPVEEAAPAIGPNEKDEGADTHGEVVVPLIGLEDNQLEAKMPAPNAPSPSEEVPVEVPIEQPVVVSMEETIDVTLEAPADDPVKVLVEEPVEAPVEASVEEPVKEPAKEPGEAPVETPIEELVNVSTEETINVALESPVDDPVKVLVEPLVEEPVEAPVEASVEEPVEELVEEPVKEPTEAPVETPIEEPVKVSMEETIDTTLEAPVDDPVKVLVEEPVEVPMEETVEALVEEPVEVLAEAPVEEPLKRPVEAPVAAPVVVPIEKTVEPSVEEPVKESVERPVEIASDTSTPGTTSEQHDNNQVTPDTGLVATPDDNLLMKSHSPELPTTDKGQTAENADTEMVDIKLEVPEIASQQDGAYEVGTENIDAEQPSTKEIAESLDERYTRLLGDLLSTENDHLRPILLSILATVSLAYRPLSLGELCLLIAIEEDNCPDSVEDLVRKCDAFLAVQQDESGSRACSSTTAIHVVDQPTREFLLGSTTLFPDGQGVVHNRIFSRCVAGLEMKLSRNMYGIPLDQSDTLARDIATPDPDPLATVHYACVYWAHHLGDFVSGESSTQLGDGDQNNVSEFLRTKSLFWLEALCLIGAFSEGVASMRKLHTLVHTMQPPVEERNNPGGPSWASLVDHVLDFMLQDNITGQAPLQVYRSARLFEPSDWLVREMVDGEQDPSDDKTPTDDKGEAQSDDGTLDRSIVSLDESLDNQDAMTASSTAMTSSLSTSPSVHVPPVCDQEAATPVQPEVAKAAAMPSIASDMVAPKEPERLERPEQFDRPGEKAPTVHSCSLAKSCQQENAVTVFSYPGTLIVLIPAFLVCLSIGIARHSHRLPS